MTTEDQQRFKLEINFWDHVVVLLCPRGCALMLTGDETLAELNRRAGEHTEVCR